MDNACHYLVVIAIIFSLCINAQDENRGVEHPSAAELQEQFPEFVCRLKEVVTDSCDLRCRVCRGNQDISFLFGENVQREKRLLQCLVCQERFHAGCLTRGKCRSCQCLVQVPNDERVLNGTQKEHQQHYVQCAQTARNRLGYRSVEAWAQAYGQEYEVAKQLFQRLLSERITLLRNPSARIPSVEEIIDQVGENAGGNSCPICLTSIEVSRIAGRGGAVGCRQCHVQFHDDCAARLAQNAPLRWIRNDQGGHHLGRPVLCPACRCENFQQRVPCVEVNGSLMPKMCPGFYANQTSIALMFRFEAYKRACRYLIPELEGENPEPQEQEWRDRQAQEALQQWRRSEAARQMQERLHRQRQQLLTKLQVASAYLATASAASCAIVPAGTVLYGACVGGAAVGVTCALAAKIKHYRNASRYQDE